ncbi:MAG: pentapeptide repeat-containing protein [Longimicrobiales bacterium]
MSGRHVLVLVAAVAAVAAVSRFAAAQAPELPVVPTFWDVAPGMHALELSPDFADLACGTNGGPPSTRIGRWNDFAACPPEDQTGLHEVQFREDDEPEYIARAYNNQAAIAALEGTQIFIVPVIISALFDDDGFVVGTRAVTDPRVAEDIRMRAISLSTYLRSRFDVEGWACEDLPREEGETGIGDLFIKERCSKTTDQYLLTIESNFYRKRGQFGINPLTNEPLAGEFRSEVRFEMMLAGPVPDREARLASLSANPPPSEAEVNRARALDCPGCDLAGLNLKRMDLTGANLAGANLAGADLHGATLARADLTGANLTSANLNHATMTQARLGGADLTGAMLFRAALDGADFTGATLTYAKMGEVRMIRANFTNASAQAVDFSRARMSNAIFAGAVLGGSWFTDAQMARIDLTGAELIQVILVNAVMAGADLTRARIWGADLFGADLRNANLTGTDFTGSRLQSALLTGTNRDEAIFTDVVGLPP